MREMTNRERVLAAFRGEPTDRPAISLWRHHGGIDMTADGLTAAMVDFQATYEFDFVKFMPTGTYPIMDWGAETVWDPRPAGTRTVTKLPVRSLADWGRIDVLDVEAGMNGIVNQSLRQTVTALGPDIPVLQTIFSPLTIAQKLAGPAVFGHLRQHPERVEPALEVIAQVCAAMIKAAVDAGADLFYAVQTGTADLLALDEFRRWETAYAQRLLKPLDPSTVVMVHCHGPFLWFEEFTTWPVTALNWDDRRTGPSLQEARAQTKLGLCGGLSHQGILRLGTAAEVEAEVAEALAQVGRGLALGPGCVMPMDTPPHLIRAARRAAVAGRPAGVAA